MDRPDSNTIDGIPYKEWNEATDNMFEDRGIKFESYAEYEKEKELQEFFGKGSHGIRYNPIEDKNVEGTNMKYFREGKEWSTVNKIPAKYFFDFSQANLSPEDTKILVDAGVLKTNVTAMGDYSYSFAHQDELMRMAKVYDKFDPLNSKPIGNESIEKYIGRITKELHKTDDGTLYIIKKESGITDKMIDNGTIQRQPSTEVYNNQSNGDIYPRYGIYNTGNYNPNMNIANRAVDIISGYSRWTH
jgi:hypothetical protein